MEFGRTTEGEPSASRNVAQQICMTSGRRCWGAMFRHLVNHRHMVALLSCVSRYGLALRSCRHQTAQLGWLPLGLIGVHVTLGFVGAGGDKTFGQREGYVYRPSCCRGVLNDNDMLAYSDAEVADFVASLTWVLGKEPPLHSRPTSEQVTVFVHLWFPTGTFPQGRVCVERMIPQLDGSFKHTLQLAAFGVCLGVVSNLLSSFGTKCCLAAEGFF